METINSRLRSTQTSTPHQTNGRMPISDNNIHIAAASDTETTDEASSGRRRGGKLKKTETRPRQQWDRKMERTFVKIITIEKRKVKDTWLERKRNGVIRCLNICSLI